MPRVYALLCIGAIFICSGEETAHHERLQNATEVVKEMLVKPDGVPRDLFEKAKCVIIVPDLIKAAFIVGGKYGRGYASCRDERGRWSPPGAVRLEGGTFGLQLGASATDLIMLVMNENGMRRLLGNKFVIGAEAAAAAGPVGIQAGAYTDAVMKAEILAWSRSRGVFAGVSLDGSTLRPDKDENEKLYGKPVDNRDILLGKVKIEVPEPARVLMEALNQASKAA